ncbi:MAG: four helix bundle protein [Deltaproteobacteria bacterium]|nr:four helix bundle protein [Deltaproteobacteria bacterium]
MEKNSGQKKIRDYRDLIVWQRAHGLAKAVIKTCSKFPNTEEARIIKKQLLRSSTAIPGNIAEGYGGNKGKVFQNSLTIERREATETDYWLFLSFELGYIEGAIHLAIEKGYQEVRAMLSSFISRLEKSL